MTSVRQIHPLFAAEVTGVDLAALTADQVAVLQDAIHRYAVLVFPAQRLDDDHLLDLGRLFGDVEPPRNHRVQQRLKHAELADISNLTASNELRAKDDHRRLDALGNRLWHSDASFREVPGALSMLFAHIVPPAGGETEFADLRAAYDGLPEDLQREIAGLEAEHYALHSRIMLGDTSYTEEQKRAIPPAVWPLVRTHAGSGRKLLWVGIHATHVLGMTVAEGRMLLMDLLEHATQRQYVYRHHWRVGDLVMWDNRAVLHRGRRFDLSQRREMRRATTEDAGSPVA